MSALRKKSIDFCFDNGSVPPFSTQGVRRNSKTLAMLKEKLQRILPGVYAVNRVRLSCLRQEVMRVVRRLERLSKATISEGVCDWHTKGRYQYPCMTAEAHQQQAARAMDYLTQAMTQNMEWYESLSQPLPTPQLATLQTSKFTVKHRSIMLKPSQLELDMYAEVLRLSGGKHKLFPLAYDVCTLQILAKAVIAANSQQAQAIEQMYAMTTAQGVSDLILACRAKFPAQLHTDLWAKVLYEVDWLLAEPSRFDDEEPSCIFHDVEATAGTHHQQQLEEPAIHLQQQVQQHQVGGAADAHRQQQPSAAVEDATCTEKVGEGTKTKPKAKGKVWLRGACKRLLGVLACGLIAKGAQAAATRLVGSNKS